MNESKTPDSEPHMWKIWATVVVVDSIACGFVFMFLSTIFGESLFGREGQESGISATIRQFLQGAGTIAVLLCFVKFTVCPQYWVLLLGMCRRRYELTEDGAVRVTATLLRCFLLAYPLAFVLFFVGSFRESDSLLDCLGMVARYWYDWDYNLGLIKPSALFSAFVTGPIMAVLFARSA